MRKRYLVMALTTFCIGLSATACSSSSSKVPETTVFIAEAQTTIANESTTDAATDVATDAVTDAVTDAATEADSSENIDSAASDLNSDEVAEKTLAEKSIDAIYANKPVELMLGNGAINLEDENSLKYYTGLTAEDADKIASAAYSEPMMSSQAYSLVVVEVKDVADAADIAQKIKDNIDTRKWICVEADDMTVETKDNLVMLCMTSSDLSDVVTSKDIASAFLE